METKEKNVNEFTVPSAEDIVVNLVYWFDMARLRTQDILNGLPKSDNNTKSEV